MQENISNNPSHPVKGHVLQFIGPYHVTHISTDRCKILSNEIVKMEHKNTYKQEGIPKAWRNVRCHSWLGLRDSSNQFCRCLSSQALGRGRCAGSFRKTGTARSDGMSCLLDLQFCLIIEMFSVGVLLGNTCAQRRHACYVLLLL